MTRVAPRAAAIGLSLAALACEAGTTPAQPTALNRGTTAREGTPGATSASHGGSVDANQPVFSFADLAHVGSSQLVRTPNGVNFNLRSTALTPGHAYTLWIVIFNEPGQCGEPSERSLCGPSDVVNDAAKPDMMYAAGGVAGNAGTGNFAGRRSVDDRSGSLNAPVGMPAYGLLDPRGAEFHLVVHDHGPKLPEFMPDMIQTVAGGCPEAGIPAPGVPSPFNDYTGPEYGRRGPNTCMSVQFAVHTP
jgi:hypothetical protein